MEKNLNGKSTIKATWSFKKQMNKDKLKSYTLYIISIAVLAAIPFAGRFVEISGG